MKGPKVPVDIVEKMLFFEVQICFQFMYFDLHCHSTSMFWIFNVEYPYHLKPVYNIHETMLKIHVKNPQICCNQRTP